MEKKQPQKCSPELKAKVEMAAISGQVTVQKIMKKYGVSKTSVYTWNIAVFHFPDINSELQISNQMIQDGVTAHSVSFKI